MATHEGDLVAANRGLLNAVWLAPRNPVENCVKHSLGEMALALRQAADTGAAIAPLRDGLADIDAAYAVQEINTNYALANGRHLIGRKIGLTSRAVQQQVGVDQPDFGMLFDDMSVGEGELIAVGRVLQPRVEVEIALILSDDLIRERPTIADIIRATSYALPSIEVVGSRVRNWDIAITDTVADNASSGVFILGGPARRLDGLDLRNCAMRLLRNGEEVSTGSGAACLGHPLNAAVWLAGEMVARGRPLQRGDVVLCGALGPVADASPGDVFEGWIEGVGGVTTGFASVKQELE